ncbi:MAG TPA: hypothetical protein VF599_12105 [Pyrinomonadaceae bacterium]|jgi:hypothetical protein
MNNELSIDHRKSEIDLENNKSDNTASALKAAVETFIPGIGSILSEVISVVIPNQKIDRIKLFAQVLDQKVNFIEQEILEVKMKTEEFTDLLEDALRQASRALSDERRDYIASFLKNSLTNEEISHLEEKKLLSILNELNDAEIILLKYEALDQHEKRDFYEQHSSIVSPEPPSLRGTRVEYDKYYLHKSYKNSLQDLGLVEPVFKKPRKGEMPEFDGKTGMVKSTYRQATGLGRLLLRYIDQGVEDGFDE